VVRCFFFPILLSPQFALGSGQGSLSIAARVIGSSVVSSPMQYWYRSASVVSVGPSTGPTSGGTAVTILGSDMGVQLASTTLLGCTAANRVLIGGRACDVTQVRGLLGLVWN
jgi:hypothetical protein